MRKLTQVVAVVAVLSLLSQNMLFAQQTSNGTYVPLPEIQQQAQKDATFLQKHGLLTVTGVTSVGILFATLYIVKQQVQIKVMEKALAESIEGNVSHLKTVDELTQKLTQKQLEVTEQNQALLRGREVAQARRESLKKELLQTKKAAQEMELMYKQQVKELTEQLALAQSELNINHLGIYLRSPNEVLNLEKYSKLFDKTVSKEEKQILRQEIRNAQWYTVLPQTEKDIFESSLDYSISVLEGKVSQESSKLFSQRLFTYLSVQHLPQSMRLIKAMLHDVVFKNKAVVVGALLFGMTAFNTVSASTASYEKAARIDANFNLFLNASEEELAQMEQDPVVYEACVRNAAALWEVAHNTSNQELTQLHSALTNTEVATQSMRQSMQRSRAIAR